MLENCNYQSINNHNFKPKQEIETVKKPTSTALND